MFSTVVRDRFFYISHCQNLRDVLGPGNYIYREFRQLTQPNSSTGIRGDIKREENEDTGG